MSGAEGRATGVEEIKKKKKQSLGAGRQGGDQGLLCR